MAKLDSGAVSMPLKSCMLPHLPGQPKLQKEEFFLMQGEKGEPVVCKAKRLEVRSGLPQGPPRPAHKTRLEKVLADKLLDRMALIRRLSIVLVY